ncbi:MAG: type VI secretion system-associated protein TagF [Candidatus Contendobacter sp.]|nr:type VI secretion system-associated protein TagF [Candidatus Contendobacter sp.]
MSGATVTPESTGFFGKLPSRGDFIGRHLSRSFLEPWDDWLQAAIAASRIQLGESWRDYYCTSPIWRFALGPGLCGPAAHAGILMPSMDRVGRYYPLVIAAALEPDWPLLTLPTRASAWFQRAEQLALAGLDNDALELDDFSRQVETLGPPPPVAGFVVSDATASRAWCYPLPDTLDWPQILPGLATHLLTQGFAQPSLWWTEGSEWVPRCLLLCEGLPPTDGFAALLAGDWRQRGWSEKPLVGIHCDSGEPLAADEDEE